MKTSTKAGWDRTGDADNGSSVGGRSSLSAGIDGGVGRGCSETSILLLQCRTHLIQDSPGGVVVDIPLLSSRD